MEIAIHEGVLFLHGMLNDVEFSTFEVQMQHTVAECSMFGVTMTM